jgi:hypothetical protein
MIDLETVFLEVNLESTRESRCSKLGTVTSLNRCVADKSRRAEQEVTATTESAERRRWKRKGGREDTRRQRSVTEDIRQPSTVNSHDPPANGSLDKGSSPHGRGSPGGLA